MEGGAFKLDELFYLSADLHCILSDLFSIELMRGQYLS